MCVQIIKHQMKKHKSGHNVGTEADILKMSHFWCNTESVTPIDYRKDGANLLWM